MALVRVHLQQLWRVPSMLSKHEFRYTLPSLSYPSLSPPSPPTPPSTPLPPFLPLPPPPNQHSRCWAETIRKGIGTRFKRCGRSYRRRASRASAEVSAQGSFGLLQAMLSLSLLVCLLLPSPLLNLPSPSLSPANECIRWAMQETLLGSPPNLTLSCTCCCCCVTTINQLMYTSKNKNQNKQNRVTY